MLEIRGDATGMNGLLQRRFPIAFLRLAWTSVAPWLLLILILAYSHTVGCPLCVVGCGACLVAFGGPSATTDRPLLPLGLHSEACLAALAGPGLFDFSTFPSYRVVLPEQTFPTASARSERTRARAKHLFQLSILPPKRGCSLANDA